MAPWPLRREYDAWRGVIAHLRAGGGGGGVSGVAWRLYVPCHDVGCNLCVFLSRYPLGAFSVFLFGARGAAGRRGLTLARPPRARVGAARVSRQLAGPAAARARAAARPRGAGGVCAVAWVRFTIQDVGTIIYNTNFTGGTGADGTRNGRETSARPHTTRSKRARASLPPPPPPPPPPPAMSAPSLSWARLIEPTHELPP